MRTTSSYRRSWPGRRLLEAALERPNRPCAKSCATVRAAGGSFCRTGRGCHVDRRAGQRSSPARALVRLWAPGQHVSWGKSPFGRMGRLHYRICVRVQGAVPTVVPGAAVVPAAAVPSTPAAWTRCWTGCSRWRWPAYRTRPWPLTWWGCGWLCPGWRRSSPAGWWSSTAAGRPGSPGRCPPRPGCAGPAGCPPGLADLRAQGDPAGAEAAAAAAHDRRRLTVAGTFAGAVVLDGVLDPEAGATVLAALAPLAAPGGADDDRTPAQRRADALVELARRALDGAGLPSVGGERPHIQVRVDLATLLARTGTASADWAGPLTAGAVPVRAS